MRIWPGWTATPQPDHGGHLPPLQNLHHRHPAHEAAPQTIKNKSKKSELLAQLIVGLWLISMSKKGQKSSKNTSGNAFDRPLAA